MSTPQQREEEIFADVLEKPSEERGAFLDAACRGEPRLRRRIEALLAMHEQADAIPPSPAEQMRPLGRGEAPDEFIGQVMGRYKLLEQIGEGGCGVVYVAEQTEPLRRRVALKLVKLGMDTKQVVARFEAERQALAMMDHPNIAKVLDAGATETGRPYFVMELVRGSKITDYCNQNRLRTERRLKLFTQVCHAVQHAHQKGIIHRDLKPSNILVSQHDPASAGVPKVIDFGIAKAINSQTLTDKTIFTAFEQFIGTPAYMSPEQAEMSGLDIDTRTDIYSLGMLLYELLTGRTPFDARELLSLGLEAMRRTIREQEPPRPSTRLHSLQGQDLTTTTRNHATELPKLIHQIRGDLDWIVMKCLEKDRARRYETANGLAMDIERHLNTEPVTARPPSKLYVFQKTLRRHKVGFAATAAFFVVLAAGVMTSTWQAVRATQAEHDQASARALAEEASKIAKENELLAQANAKKAREQEELASQQESLARRRYYAAQMNLANQAAEAGDFARCLDLLETQRPLQGEEDMRAFEWYFLWKMSNARHVRTLQPREVSASWYLGFSADGSTLVSENWAGTVQSWDVATGQEKSNWKGKFSRVTLTPDRRTMIGVADKTITEWDLETGQLRSTISGPPVNIQTLVVSPHGRTLAGGTTDGRIVLWNLETKGHQTSLLAGTGRVHRIAFSPDSTLMASSTEWGTQDTKLWDMTAEPPRLKFSLKPGGNPLAFSPNGQLLAGGGWTDIDLYDTVSGRHRAVLRGHLPVLNDLAFLPNGMLASCSKDHTIRLWRLRFGGDCDGRVCISPAEDGDPQSVTIQFRPTGGPLAGAAVVKLHLGWNDWHGLVAPDPTMNFIPTKNRWEYQARVPPDARQIDVVFNNGTDIWDNNDGLDWHFVRETDRKPIASSADPAAGDFVPQSSSNSWKALFGPPEEEVLGAHLDAVWTLAVSPDGSMLASGGTDGLIRLWDTSRTLKQAQSQFTDSFRIGARRGLNSRLWSIMFSPDGRALCGVTDSGMVTHDVKTGEESAILQLASGCGALSPDGKLLATGTEDGVLRLWDYSQGKLLGSVSGHSNTIVSVAFSPDNRFIATTAWANKLKIWNATAGLKLHWASEQPTDAAAFSPDGRTVAAALQYAGDVLLDVETGKVKRRLATSSGAANEMAIAFSPNGKYLALGNNAGAVNIYDSETSQCLAELKGHTSGVNALAFAPDNRTLVTGSEDRTVKLWDPLTGQERVTFRGSESVIKTVTFSPDGNTLAAGSLDGTVRLWRSVRDAAATASAQPAREAAPDEAAKYNTKAWALVVNPLDSRQASEALQLVQQAVRLNPTSYESVNTLGVAYYRANQLERAVATLQMAGQLNANGLTAFDLYFLAMAHHQIGESAKAKDCFDQAIRWESEPGRSLSSTQVRELRSFQKESEALLGIESEPAHP